MESPQNPSNHHSTIILRGSRWPLIGRQLCRETPVSRISDVIFSRVAIQQSVARENISEPSVIFATINSYFDKDSCSLQLTSRWYCLSMVTGKFPPKQIPPWKTSAQIEQKILPPGKFHPSENSFPRKIPPFGKFPLDLKFTLPAT